MSGALDRAALARAFAEIGVRRAACKSVVHYSRYDVSKRLDTRWIYRKLKYMYFNIGEVVAIYRNELEKRPYELYGLTKE